MGRVPDHGQGFYMNMVSHVAMRTQVRPRTESEEKLRCEVQISASKQRLYHSSTYVQLLLFPQPVHVRLIVFVAMVVCNISFFGHRCAGATTCVA